MLSQSTLAFRLGAVGLAVLVAAASAPAVIRAQAALLATHPAAIVGSAWDADNSPLPGARVRLRNIVTGDIAGSAVADQMGQFVFADVATGSYVVELVSDSGKILTIGQPLALRSGETIATFVRLGRRSPWFEGFFGSAALAVASAAAATGLTAIAPEQVRSVSARQ
jgi:hypothetical protein